MTNPSCQIITWILIVAGWIIVHYLTVTRERHKEIREQKSNLCSAIIEIEKNAIAFHQSLDFNPDLARNLMSSICRISNSISKPPLKNLRVAPDHIKKFRQSITLKNFEKRDFLTLEPNSRIISNISLSTERLINALDDSYSIKYMSRWWQIFKI